METLIPLQVKTFSLPSRRESYGASRGVRSESAETTLERLDSLAILPYALSQDALGANSLWAGLAEEAKAARREAKENPFASPGGFASLDYALRSLARETRFFDSRQEALRQYICGLQNSVQVFPVADVLNEALDLLDPVWERADVLLRCRIAPCLPVVRANRHRLQRSLVALLLNSVEALEGGSGTLAFSAEAEQDSEGNVQGVCITLKDNGRGMEPEVLARARQAGFSAKPGGLGMGLAFADAFARASGGRLDVESETGRGTNVALRLPALHASTQDDALYNLRSSSRTSGGNVLVAA